MQSSPYILVLHLKRVLRPTGIETFGNDGRLYHAFQLLGITIRHLIDINKFVVLERLQLDQKNGCLNAVHARVHADADVVVAVAALTVDVIRVNELRPLIIVGEHRAAVAIAAHGFGGEERSGGNVTESAGLLVADAPTEALSTVFQHVQTVLISQFADGFEVSGETEQVDGNDDARLEFSSLHGLLDFALKVSDIHIKGILVNINEDRCRALHGNDFRRGKEGETGHEHGIARFHVPSLQSQKEGIGAAVAGDAVLCADILGESSFHLLDFRSHDVGRRSDHVEDSFVHFVLQDGILGFQVSELHNQLSVNSCSVV